MGLTLRRHCALRHRNAYKPGHSASVWLPDGCALRRRR
jgi:hypothetical protein